MLKSRIFTNPVGELVNMKHRENQCAEKLFSLFPTEPTTLYI
uniref:Uncharacterized protein n=1 Tax=Trichinella nativa TaxID=6335 RepID=A0A0V1K2S6_9BILA